MTESRTATLLERAFLRRVDKDVLFHLSPESLRAARSYLRDLTRDIFAIDPPVLLSGVLGVEINRLSDLSGTYGAPSVRDIASFGDVENCEGVRIVTLEQEISGVVGYTHRVLFESRSETRFVMVSASTCDELKKQIPVLLHNLELERELAAAELHNVSRRMRGLQDEMLR